MVDKKYLDTYESKIRSLLGIHVKVTEHARNAIRDDGYEMDDILKSIIISK
ncbi:MAG: hypothetical protein KGI33_07125 [Thaumarchaeota archaeon]|nr:hypothetical protein [Nitrososphaerota archaeon]